MKVTRLSALRTGRLYHPGDTPGTQICYRLRRLQGQSAAGRNKSVKNPNDPIGVGRTPPRTPFFAVQNSNWVTLNHQAYNTILSEHA